MAAQCKIQLYVTALISLVDVRAIVRYRKGAEKVFTSMVEELPFKDDLIKLGLDPSDRVMYDAGSFYYTLNPVEL